MPGKRWTKEEVAKVNELALQGETNQYIANVLNRSSQAVANKKISIRDPGYYLRAQARADMEEAHLMNAGELPDTFSTYETELALTAFAVFIATSLFVGGVLAFAGVWS